MQYVQYQYHVRAILGCQATQPYRFVAVSAVEKLELPRGCDSKKTQAGTKVSHTRFPEQTV